MTVVRLGYIELSKYPVARDCFNAHCDISRFPGFLSSMSFLAVVFSQLNPSQFTENFLGKLTFTGETRSWTLQNLASVGILSHPRIFLQYGYHQIGRRFVRFGFFTLSSFKTHREIIRPYQASDKQITSDNFKSLFEIFTTCTLLRSKLSSQNSMSRCFEAVVLFSDIDMNFHCDFGKDDRPLLDGKAVGVAVQQQ